MRVVAETGKVFTEKDAAPGENIFILLFNPTCDHCHEATRVLGAADSLFKDGQVYLMATANMQPHLGYFANVTRHKEHPILRVGVDSTGFIEKTFNYQTLPELLIYDRSRRLVRTMSVTIAVDSLRPYLGPTARQYEGRMPTAAPASGPFLVKPAADKRKQKKRSR